MVRRAASATIAGALVAAMLIGVQSVPARAYTVTPSYTYVVGSANSFMDTGDGAPTLIRDGSNVYLIGRVDSQGRPAIWKGTSMDNLVAQPTGNLDSSYTTTNGEQYWWNGGGWVDGAGKWYVITHIEFNNVSGVPMKRIGLSTSTDKGLNWHYAGDLLTSDNSYNLSDFHNYFDFGAGEPSLFVDTASGYFYIWFMNTWWNTGNHGEYASSIRVARSPISSNMAPGTWKYFYNGTWTENALGGRSSDVLPNAAGNYVVYSTYLNKYVLITSKLYSGHDIDGGYLATATDLSQQNWTNFHLLTATTDHYMMVTTADGTATGTVGQSMRWYTHPSNGSVYRTITFGTGSQSAQGMAQQHLPRLLVNDANPYWDWCVTPRPASFTDNFDSGDMSAWRTYNGSWAESGGILSVDSGAGNRAAIESSWFDDVTYDADVRISNVGGNAGIVFRSANNDYGVDNYRGYYAGISGSQLILGRADNSDGTTSWTQLATAPIAVAANVFYHLKVIADAGLIQVFFNNSPVEGVPSLVELR